MYSYKICKGHSQMSVRDLLHQSDCVTKMHYCLALPNYPNLAWRTSNVSPTIHTARTLLCVTFFCFSVLNWSCVTAWQRFDLSKTVLKRTETVLGISTDELQHFSQEWRTHWVDCIESRYHKNYHVNVDRVFLEKKSFFYYLTGPSTVI